MVEINYGFMKSIEKSRLLLVEAVSKALDDISTEKGPLLLTFWGNKGIGKTTLLNNIVRVLQSRPQVQIVEVENFTQLSLAEIEAVTQEKLSTLSSDTIKVLFLDNLDELLRKDKDSQTFFDFERNTILPLIEQGRILILATSQIELNQWREDDVRVRQVNYQIPAFGIDEVTLLVNMIGIEPNQAYDLTFGQPKVVDWLVKNPSMTEKEIAGKAWEYLLEDIPKKALEMAEVICLLPVFNIFLLRKIMETDTPNGESRYMDYLEQVKEFIRRGIVYWDVSIGSYRFTDSAVRRLLARHVLYENPDRYNQIQQIAADYFRDEAKSPGYLHMHLVSAVYHLAQTMRSLPSQGIGSAALKWVQDNINAWLSARWSEVLKAWQGGAGEIAVTYEIKKMIGDAYFSAITQEIDKARQMMEMTK